jgi:hypothetical protein
MAEGIANSSPDPTFSTALSSSQLESPPDRMTERQLWAEFDRRKAGIFGSLCDLLAAEVRRPQRRL